MPHVDKHTPGDFSWLELATTDQTSAKKFYASLYGWVANDMAMGPDSYYTIFRMDARDTSAAYTMDAEETSRHIPPHWNLYIAVDNADAAAAKATELEGKVLAPAFDVLDAGRMAVIQDPTGATFSVWQPKKNIGIGVTNDPGTFCWADLNTPDPERAKKFYSGLFGWEIMAGEKDPSGYLHIKNGGRFIGGVPPAGQSDPNAPPHWLIYFAVADVDATSAKAKQLGAKLYVPAMSIEGVGRMAVLADPQGAVSAIFTPQH